MKLLILMAAVVAACNGESDGDFDYLTEGKSDYIYKNRMCPEGYTYAGEDTNIMNGTLMLGGLADFSEEIYRSKTYSCYKIVTVSDGFNEALDICNNDEGHLVRFEDEGEVDRVMMQMLPEFPNDPFYDGMGDDIYQFTTGALRFTDVNEWIWLGTNLSVLFEVSATENADEEQCLAITVDMRTVPYRLSHVHFRSVRCNQPTVGLCEVRVQMVTYYAWFVSNWVSFLLIVMTILLISALCVTLFRSKSGRRMYRGHARCSPAAPRNNLPYNDAPPTYNDVTGIQTTNETKMDKYKNKGKEVLAKVTLYTKAAIPSKTTTTNSHE